MINFIQQVFIPSLYIYSEQNKRFKKMRHHQEENIDTYFGYVKDVTFGYDKGI